MRFLSLTYTDPQQNLACDEALLDACEEESGPEILRVWEPAAHFVVAGHSNRLASEVDLEQCLALGIPVVRRRSGGGAVLQGPGCLNYAVILKTATGSSLSSIKGTTAFVLGRVRSVLQSLLQVPVDIAGLSDLAIQGRKISGSAQRRRLSSLLFHGTILLDLNIKLVEQVLRLPSKQPAYRDGRTHSAFMMNIGISPLTVVKALRAVWNADEECKEVPVERVAHLVHERYARHEWTYKL